MVKKFFYLLAIGFLLLASSGCTLMKVALSAAAAYGISQAFDN